MCSLQKLGQIRSRLIVRRKHIVHVLFVSIVVQLATFLDPSWHLFFDLVDVRGGPVRVFEGSPCIEQFHALFVLLASAIVQVDVGEM